MENDLLIYELKELQIAYKAILQQASIDIFRVNSGSVIDEINVFWQRNKKLVKCILKNISSPYRAYVFTGATILDMEDFEHYPLVTLGKYHFRDDPICQFSVIDGKAENTVFNEEIREQIVAIIDDNIKILDEAVEIIYILPISFLSEVDNETVHKAGMQVFLSLFTQTSHIKNTLKRCCKGLFLKNIHSRRKVSGYFLSLPANSEGTD